MPPASPRSVSSILLAARNEALADFRPNAQYVYEIVRDGQAGDGRGESAMRSAANGTAARRAFFGAMASTMLPLPEEAVPSVEFAFSALHVFSLA
jgi:hypothetical protein